MLAMPSDLKPPPQLCPHNTLSPILRSDETRLDKDEERDPQQGHHIGNGGSGGKKEREREGHTPLSLPMGPWADCWPGLSLGGAAKEAPHAGEQGMGCTTTLLQASGERTKEEHEVVQARAREDGAEAPGGQDKGCACTCLLPP